MIGLLTIPALLTLIAQSAPPFETGEKVVVTRPTTLKTNTGATPTLSPGSRMTVQAVEGDRLKVAAGKVGWINASDVVHRSDAETCFAGLIKANPQDATPLRARGRSRFEAGDLDNAIADLDRSLALTPNSEAHTLRGFAWKRKGDKDKAMADLERAIALNPSEALAWRVRGATWAGMADYQKALADYSESIRIDPENPESLHHRALLLSACTVDRIRDGKRAVEDATKACEVTEWTNPLFLNGLATACAEKGDFDSAIAWQTKAAGLTSPDQSKAMMSRVDQYRQHKPFRMTWR